MADKLEIELLRQTKDLIEDFNKEVKTMLVSKRNLSSNSKTINELEVVINESSNYTGLLGVEYFYYVVHGRGPGRFPPPYEDGTWPLPFPAAKVLAEKGNLAKMRPVADAFDVLVKNLIEKINKKVGDVMLAFFIVNTTIDGR